jgi:transposase
MFMALELRENTWKLGCTTGHGQQPRERPVAARHQACVLQEVLQAKRRFGLPDTAPVVSCSEAGREGFWLHRFLQAQGITHTVVDSSSLAVNRRQRRAKSDGVDVRKLLRLLMRYAQGEREVWRVVPVPSAGKVVSATCASGTAPEVLRASQEQRPDHAAWAMIGRWLLAGQHSEWWAQRRRAHLP